MTGDRRNKEKPPYPNMEWSEKYGMWLDKDTRTPQQKAADEAIAADVERRRKEGKV